MSIRYSIKNNKLKRAQTYASNLSENLENYPAIGIDKSNPYYGYANYLRLCKIASKTNFETNQQLNTNQALKKPVPPNEPKPKDKNNKYNQTPKVKFVKKGGKTRKSNKKNLIKTRRYKNKSNKTKHYK